MKHILIIGAGRSASALIKYLLEQSRQRKWKVSVGDMSKVLAEQKTLGYPEARAFQFDIHDQVQREKEIQSADLVISMLPASMHMEVARDCVRFGKHLVTASYVSKEIAELDEAARKAGVVLLNEMGLDPGIDHMSAMEVIDSIHASGGKLTSFRSYCGGLVAPESNNNPWGYKFSWNPRNVILAGQGTARYIEQGSYKYIPYNRLFLQTEKISVEGQGDFEAYANRDSLSYRKAYGLEHIPTMLRGTLRMPDYCRAWNVFVKLGWTDDSYLLEKSEELTYNDLLRAFLPGSPYDLKVGLKKFMGEEMDDKIMSMLEWLDIFSDKKTGLAQASPAQILQDFLEKRWKLEPGDKDMIVMQHQFEYVVSEHVKGQGPNTRKITSSLVVKGEDQVYTAMAKTVGLPVAIGAILILEGKIKARGVLIPTLKEIYAPVLIELGHLGIRFHEKEN